jgi:hypothetical protein
MKAWGYCPGPMGSRKLNRMHAISSYFMHLRNNKASYMPICAKGSHCPTRDTQTISSLSILAMLNCLNH